MSNDSTGRIGGNMPDWNDKLTDAQIRGGIAWLQAKWPDEIYVAWYRNTQWAEKR